MNNPRATTIIFAIADLILIAVFGFMYLSKDRVPPVIQFQATELTYMPTTLNDELLNGAQAYDAKDGDVSDRVVIEKIVLNRSTKNAVVYYAASDYDGNVGKSSRTFPASPLLFTEAAQETTENKSDVSFDTNATQTGVMTTAGAETGQMPVSEQNSDTGAQGAGPLMQNAGGGQDRQIIGALDNAGP